MEREEYSSARLEVLEMMTPGEVVLLNHVERLRDDLA